MPKKSLDPIIVINGYLKDLRTLTDLSVEYGVTPSGILRLLQRHKIPIRNKHDACQVRHAVVREQIKHLLPIALSVSPALPPTVLATFLQPYAAVQALSHGLSTVAIVEDLAIVVIDQETWDVDSIMDRSALTHAEARKYMLTSVQKLQGQARKGLFLWRDELNSPALEKLVAHKTGANGRVCSARECEVSIIPSDKARPFYKEHHLQGGCNAPMHYGLFYETKLVACMSFNHGGACRGSDAHLLQRFAVAGSIPGAASKLLSAFRKDHLGPVISYSDERYAPGGGLYTTLGFTETALGKPDYRYWRDSRWYAKNTKQRKHLIAELAEKGQAPVEGDTEFTMARRLGYKRCYDAGKRTWLLA